MAKMKDISIIFHADNLSDLWLEEQDIVSLLSNLLDNAIEACEKVNQDKLIQIKKVIFIIRQGYQSKKIRYLAIKSMAACLTLHVPWASFFIVSLFVMERGSIIVDFPRTEVFIKPYYQQYIMMAIIICAIFVLIAKMFHQETGAREGKE